MARQEFAEESDINTIVKQFGLTGQLPTDVRIPMTSEFVETVDYHSAMNAVIAADAAFMQLPADVRLRFNHDPQQLMDFVANDANRDEARRLGLLVPEKAPLPPLEVVVKTPSTGST